MKKVMTNEYWDRVRQWLKVLQKDFYQPLGEIAFSGFTSYDMLSREEAEKQAFTPVNADTQWGHTWEYMWLKGNIELPKAAEGKKIVLDLRFEGEATLFLNGQEFGTHRADWVPFPHHFLVDNIIAQSGKAGEKYDLLCEVYAGHYFPGTQTGPVLPGTLKDSLEEGKRCKIGTSTYGIWNEDAYQLYLDLNTLFLLYQQQDDKDLWTADIADALEKSTHIIEFEQDADARAESYREARKFLSETLKTENAGRQATMYTVGNAHLDLAWLWPFEETCRKTARTFAQQLRLIEMYPEYKFIQSQPASYEMCRRFYPDLYRRIVEASKRGQWIADGAMYVEPDTNMSSGEALIRQLLYGKEFYKKEFDVDSDVLWLPDTFGYTAALPQILLGCNVKYLVTQKIFWSYNDADQFPYHYFTWKGMDGSEITSFLPTSYTYDTDPESVCKTWKKRVQDRNLDSFLMPIGYGDGGGGPTRDHIEYVRRGKNLQGMPKMEMCSPHDFFVMMEKKNLKKGTWNGELYFSAHRGTFTSQALVKKNNRRSENILRNYDLLSALVSEKTGRAPDYEQKKKLWKKLLLNQFHDILPGSGIGKIYAEANALHAELQTEAAGLIEKSLSALAAPGEGIAVFNDLGWDRTALIPVDERFAKGAVTTGGTPVPVVNGLALAQVPAMGFVTLVPAVTKADAPCSARKDGDRYILENEKITAVFNACGQMLSYVNRENGVKLEGRAMNRLLFFKDVPRAWDAWDIDSNYKEDELPLPEDADIQITADSGLEAAITVKRTIGKSALRQVISIRGGSEQVFFRNDVDWHEFHRLLKVRFDGGVHASNAIHEMQFGFVERPVFESNAFEASRYEVCNHHYTALCDNNFGFAVLNDSKYGVSTCDGTIDLTLLRAPSAPDPEADQGQQSFTYAFTAWTGGFASAPVIREGYELNQPVAVCSGVAKDGSAFTVDNPAVILETVKLAEDESGDLILRLYEATRGTQNANLHINLPGAWRVAPCNMLETPAAPAAPVVSGAVPLAFTPFQIKTLRLTKA